MSEGDLLSTGGVTTLLESSIEAIASRIDSYTSISCLPEELCIQIFERVLLKGKLNPRVLRLFQDTRHELLSQWIAELHVRDTPPIVPTTRNSWLGDKSHLY